MPTITAEAYKYFENKIYLHMVVKVLEQDLELIMKMPFKLHRPYIALLEKALEFIRTDLKKTDIYLLRNNMKLIRESINKEHSKYVFIHLGYEERKRYSNVDLGNETERRMILYLTK